MATQSIDEKQYVVFKLGPEVFGVDINMVKEIIIYQKTTKVPGTGELIEGVINLRGSVIPIFSLRKKFSFEETENTRCSRIVVVEAGGSTVGIVVDGVSEVVMIPDEVIEKPSEMITGGVNANYIAGIANMEDRLVIVLNLEKVIRNNIAEAI